MNLAQWFQNLRHRCVEFLYRLRFQRAVAGLETPPPATRAFVVLQVDALAFSALQEVLERGDMPHLARLLQQGEYRLRRWRCGLPSTTTAIQTGLFYGARVAPGFRWYDKATGAPVTSHRPDHMRALEESLSAAHDGLLVGGGVYTSLLSGEAERAVFTVSRVFMRQLQGYLEGTGLLLIFLLRPLRVLRLIHYTLVRFGRRVWAGLRHWKTLLVPLSLLRSLLDAAADATLTEFMTFCVLLDLYRGVPRMYANFNGYDEMAHVHGALHHEARWVLHWIDARLEEIEKLGRESPGASYDVFILSDHGMAPAIPFRVRFGQTLGEFVAQQVHLDVSFDAGAMDAAVARALRARYLIMMLRDSQQYLPPWIRRLVDVARRPLLAYLSPEEPAYDWNLESEVVVQASGPLAHVYFRVAAHQMDLPEATLLYAEFMGRLVGHEGIELVAGRDTGQVVILGRKGGVLTIADEKTELQGADPLEAFADREYVMRELRHLLQLPTSGDLVLLGRLLETGEVITFEEQYATHGGLGGGQDEPFLIYPAALEGELPELDSPEALYRWFKARYST